MSRQTNTRKAQIEALTAQYALLAASLEQAKAQGTAQATQAAAIAFNCAETLSEQSNWLLALFQAIGHYTSASEATNLGSIHTANQLAAIGGYLADTGYESAQDIQMQVKGGNVMMTIKLFEGAGHAAALTMLDTLLNSKNQGEAAPVISDFLYNIGTATGEEELRTTCAGASVALVDVLLTGLSEIRKRSA